MTRPKLHTTGLGRWNTLFQASVNRLLEKRLAHMQLTFTREEFVDLAVPEHIRGSYLAVTELLSPHYSEEQTLDVELENYNVPVRLKFNIVDNFRLFPLKNNTITSPNVDCDAGRRLVEWARERVEVGRQMGKLSKVLSELNSHCQNLHQARFYFPSLLSLAKLMLDDSGYFRADTEALVAKLEEPVSPSKLPTLPVELRKACSEVSSYVAGIQLLDKVSPQHDAVVGMLGWNTVRFSDELGDYGIR